MRPQTPLVTLTCRARLAFRYKENRVDVLKQAMAAVRSALERHDKKQQVVYVALEIVRNLSASTELVPSLARKRGFVVRVPRVTPPPHRRR